MVDEIVVGIDGTELKAGIIAEIGSSEGVITPLEEGVYRRGAAHIETGRPISTHTSFSTMGWNSWCCYRRTASTFPA